MTHIPQGWGEGPGGDYEALAQRFRGLFDEIRAGAIERERGLPHQEVRQLADAGLTALRVPKEYGGGGATLSEFFALLIELGAADSNLVQAIRAHAGFVEVVLNSKRGEWRERWLRRIAEGALVGPGRGERGDEVKQGVLGTRLSKQGEQWILNGTKFYSTGLAYADWADVGAVGDDGTPYAVVVRRDAPGVEVVDDWNGFGQRLTSSGTTHYRNVVVDAAEIRSDDEKFPYSQAFYQLFHLANIAGIGRAVADETAALVRERKRSFSSGNAPLVRDDPQILEVVGRLRGAAYSAGAIVLQNARAIERAWQASASGDEAATRAAREIVDLEVAQAQTIVIELILLSSSHLFDALGASSTLPQHGLDRFWRNVRTLATHNPRVYKDRIAGDFAVNGTPAQDQWKIGVV
ncbi:monooxygenase [Corticibacter populi]|uniref:Monooxygenase n=1 Tax=Corticibacter populi TaxID=1550736 RepID=A0A3M6QXI9_9BURK|nr:acyl-CoA dehydrogenase family protein [Corticibacter populi]RMX07718.1 monooxygenase [Corticibacter populi]RZS30234.1 alkylation response protein AidB-like acyl-CoA dehydrogenase [Corticibacter populi]